MAHDSDLEQVRSITLSACAGADGVEAVPPPEAWVEEFGDSSVNLVVRYWHASDIASRWRIRNVVAISVKRAFDDAGVTIPSRNARCGSGPDPRRSTSGAEE